MLSGDMRSEDPIPTIMARSDEAIGLEEPIVVPEDDPA
jgi:hypothetical protein